MKSCYVGQDMIRGESTLSQMKSKGPISFTWEIPATLKADMRRHNKQPEKQLFNREQGRAAVCDFDPRTKW